VVLAQQLKRRDEAACRSASPAETVATQISAVIAEQMIRILTETVRCCARGGFEWRLLDAHNIMLKYARKPRNSSAPTR
jgi:hypothetical protein